MNDERNDGGNSPTTRKAEFPLRLQAYGDRNGMYRSKRDLQAQALSNLQRYTRLNQLQICAFKSRGQGNKKAAKAIRKGQISNTKKGPGIDKTLLPQGVWRTYGFSIAQEVQLRKPWLPPPPRISPATAWGCKACLKRHRRRHQVERRIDSRCWLATWSTATPWSGL